MLTITTEGIEGASAVDKENDAMQNQKHRKCDKTLFQTHFGPFN